MPPHPRDALYVAVALMFTLGVITVVYLTMFNPTQITPVSCTAATGCYAPDQPMPPPGPEHPKFEP